MTDENNTPNERPQKAGGYNQGKRERSPNRPVEILPHPDVLESYNYIVEGSAEMILSMFELEQQHRHEWEKKSLQIHGFSMILGQILGFFVAISAFVSATLIGMYGNATIATVIWVIAAALVLIAGLVWGYAKSLSQRPKIDRASIRPTPAGKVE